MTLATRLDLKSCGPSQLWGALSPELRVVAARALYAHDWGQAPTRHEADASIMHGMRFRESAVRQLPVEKRAGYLARSIRPTDSLASSLLLALHLEHRRPILSAFLDALGIPHQDGLITDDHEMKPPDAAKLKQAVASLRVAFPEDEVELYLATLHVLDRDTWGGLEPLL
ncbi:MAG TPA: hypothetical protein VFV19_16020 [Candidatus Polarisedimenticolaceae bacterium]|nr:hypothetical protein [Candidatus Polarisedimenticolaceae bacterium]